MTHQLVFRFAQLLNRSPSRLSRDVIRNVFAAGFEVLERKHCRADDLGRPTNAVRVISHNVSPWLCVLVPTMTNKFSIST